MVARVVADLLIDGRNVFHWPFKQLKKMCAVKQQDPRDIGLPVFTICSSDHGFQRFHWNVLADMTAVNDGCEHAIPGVRVWPQKMWIIFIYSTLIA
jgi:hypothetical protein